MWSRRRDKPPPPTGTTGILPVEIVFNAETRNRPLRVGATHREATKPSEARAESRRETVGRGVSPVDNWDNGRLARCEWKSGKVRRSVDFAYSTTLYPTNGVGPYGVSVSLIHSPDMCYSKLKSGMDSGVVGMSVRVPDLSPVCCHAHLGQRSGRASARRP